MLYEDLEFYTRFTITLHDALLKEPTLLDNLTLSTTERTDKFKNFFIAKWFNYEISGETIPMFKALIENRFNTLKDYYEELITAYEIKIDMLDGKMVTITRDDTKNDTFNRNVNLNGENKIYDLPRTSLTENKPTQKSDIVNSNVEDSTTNKTLKQTISKKGGVNVIDLKRDYMKLIRNVYIDFVTNFDTCFIDLYY